MMQLESASSDFSRIKGPFSWRGLVLSAQFVVLVGVAAAAAALYWPHADRLQFVFDDHLAIVRNPDVHGPNASDIWNHDFWGKPLTAMDSNKSYRPLTVWAFHVMMHTLGHDAAAFHAVNFAVHGAVTLLVCCLYWKLAHWSVGFVGGLLFAVHAVHVEAVVGTVGLADLASAACCLLAAFSAYARWRGGVALMTLCWAAGLLCKETAISVVLVVWLCHVRERQSGWRLAACVVVPLAYVWARLVLMSETGSIQLEAMNLNASPLIRKAENPFAFERGLPRYLSYLWVQVKYLQLLVWPTNLCAEYSFNCVPLVASLADPRAWWAIGWLLLFVSVGFRLAKAALHAESANSTTILLAWWWAPTVLTLNIGMTLGTTLAERLLYLSSIGFCGVVGLAFHCLWTRPTQRFMCRVLAVACVAALVGHHVTELQRRIPEWSSDQSLFESAIRVCPESAKAHDQLGHLLMETDQPADAERHFQEARRIDPDFCDVEWGFGQIEGLRGNAWSAMEHFEKAVECPYVATRAWVNLHLVWDYILQHNSSSHIQHRMATVLQHTQNTNMAATRFREAAVMRLAESGCSDHTWIQAQLAAAVAVQPNRCDLQYWRGRTFLQCGDADAALAAYWDALDCARKPNAMSGDTMLEQRVEGGNRTAVAVVDAMLGILGQSPTTATKLDQSGDATHVLVALGVMPHGAADHYWEQSAVGHLDDNRPDLSLTVLLKIFSIGAPTCVTHYLYGMTLLTCAAAHDTRCAVMNSGESSGLVSALRSAKEAFSAALGCPETQQMAQEYLSRMGS